MRMRLKKHLDERIAECADVLLAREGEGYYRLTEEQKLAYRLDLNGVFANGNPIVLEIGCGKGAWAVESARRHPELNYLAVEKLSNVIVVACENAKKADLPNLRFLNVRAENLDRYLPPHCVSWIALNFSCPFPKKTYANRRLTSENYLDIYKTLLVEGGVVTQKTDNRAFFEWSLTSFAQHGFDVTEATFDLPATADNVVTEYEAKFRAKGQPIYALTAKICRQSTASTTD